MASGEPLQVVFKQWNGVASWTWTPNEEEDQTCGICRMEFDGKCDTCQYPGDDCPIARGACKHAFHMHCIVKSLHLADQQGQPATCPLCRREWEFFAG